MKLILKTIILLVISIPFASADTVQFNHPNASLLKPASLIGATDPHQQIEFKLWLKLRNQAKLDKILHDLYTPGSKTYHHFLTPKQFRNEFFPTEANFNSVKEYIKNQDFTVISDGKPHLYIRAQGSVAKIERAFHVKLNNYRYQNKIIYANFLPPQISHDMSAYVSQITGFSSNANVDNKCTGQALPKQDSILNGVPTYGLQNSIQANLYNSSGNVIFNNMTFSGFIPQGLNNAGYTPAQIQHAYGVDQLIEQTPQIDGTGQTVVIIDSCESPTILSDANAFVNANQSFVAAQDLPILVMPPNPNPNFFITYPSGGSSYLCNPATQQTLIDEETLDVEGFHTMAPGTTIYLALEPSSSGDVNTVLSDVITDLMLDNGTYPSTTSLITMSYSSPENSSYTAIDSSLQTAESIGVSVDISSGDCGDNTGYSAANYQKSVNYPSSSPYVTAVGATGLFLDQQGNYSTEVGWGNEVNVTYTCYPSASSCLGYQLNYSNQGFTGGTTGGISRYYIAQPWQQNAISSLYAGGYGIVGTFVVPYSPSNIFRAVPDISMYGDYFPGFEIYVTITSTAVPVGIYGTSLATPFFTAILALVNEERQNLGKGPIGLAAEDLYSLPSGALHTITNPHGMGNPVSGVPNPNAFQLYQADSVTSNLNGIVFNADTSLTLGPTWNDITGVGTPYAPLFVSALAGNG